MTSPPQPPQSVCDLRARPELVAPAGSLEKLKIACLYGADAVYLGGQRFGLRTAAENFTADEIITGCAFARKHGKRVYVTLNSFFFDGDFTGLAGFLQTLELAGVNALIVSDPGAIRFCRKHSALAIHLSTQSSCVNTEAACFWKELGVSRIVLGRECTVEEAGKIRRDSGLEIEIFIHGSMCMAWSGHCVISNYTEGRDANRGGCNYACRREFSLDSPSGNYRGTFMSSRDQSGFALIDLVQASGIDALKIEGRMKSALYTATTARTYGKALSHLAKGLPFPEKLENELEKIPHRGYTTASLSQGAGSKSLQESGYGTKGDAPAPFIGIIVALLPGNRPLLQVKNAFTQDSPLEILGFDGTDTAFQSSDLHALDGTPLPSTIPGTLVVLPAMPQVQVSQVVRRRL